MIHTIHWLFVAIVKGDICFHKDSTVAFVLYGPQKLLKFLGDSNRTLEPRKEGLFIDIDRYIHTILSSVYIKYTNNVHSTDHTTNVHLTFLQIKYTTNAMTWWSRVVIIYPMVIWLYI